MLKLEDQIGVIASAAFDETRPVDWRRRANQPGRWSKGRAGLVAAVAALAIVLVGGLVALVGNDSSPTAPTGSSPTASTPPVVTAAPVPPTRPAPATSDPPAVVVPPFDPNTPAVFGEQPLLAITANGDAVAFDADNTPVLLYDGADPDDSSSLGDGANAPARIAITADGATAYVGLCCAPPVGTLITVRPPTPGTAGASPTYGYAPTLNPSSTHLAYGVEGAVTVIDLATTTAYTAEPRYGESDLLVEIHDLMWIDDGELLLLGRLENAWTRTVLRVTADGLEAETTYPFALTDDFADLKFAGTARGGEIAVHDVGTDRLLSAPLEDFGDLNEGRGSSLAVIDLPAPALSAWYTTPDHLVWVGTDHTLHDGAVTLDGGFSWARR